MADNADVQSDDLDWLLNDFADRIPQVAHILAISADGIVVAASRAWRRSRPSSSRRWARVWSRCWSAARGC
jgi:predicted regulator of Ras-like GTPase activity (Roadblock/LC7/MglB family)